MLVISSLFISASVQSASVSWGKTPEEVLTRTSEYLKKHPQDTDALFHQGVAYANLKRWSEAKNIFLNLSEKHADWPEPKNNLAVALLKQGQVEQAQKAIDEAINSHPSFRVAQQNRNRIYDYFAVQAYDRALGKNNNTSLPTMDLLTELSMKQPEPQLQVAAVEVEKKVEEAPAPPVDHVNQLKQRLLAWSRAWSAGDEKNYFLSYSRQFKPSDLRKDYTQWRNIRRIRLRKSQQTRVELDDILIYLSDNKQRAVAEFVQHYTSANYQDRVIKQLLLAMENGSWKILSEREIQKLD